MKKVIQKIHLWLGLSSGIIVFIVSITGCVYAFEKEIQDLMQPYRFITKKAQAYLAPSKMATIASEHLPNKSIHSIEYFYTNRATKAVFYSENPFNYYIMYLDPYTGKVLHYHDETQNFFFIVKYLHYCLLLPIQIGQPIVAISTLIFVVLLISGLVLWWPKNKSALQQRVWFSWKNSVKWKRKNYDLHNILGFYAFGIAFVIACTGLVWGFEWFRDSYFYVSSGGEKYVPYYEPQSDSTKIHHWSIHQKVDWAYHQTLRNNSDAQMIEVHIPENKTQAISCVSSKDESVYWKNDFVYYDQNTLKELDVTHSFGRYEKATFAQLLQRMNYDVHIGAIAGISGKILAFGISLMCASLPITGFLIWWGRKKKTVKS